MIVCELLLFNSFLYLAEKEDIKIRKKKRNPRSCKDARIFIEEIVRSVGK